MIVRRKATIEGAIARLSRRGIAAPATPLQGEVPLSIVRGRVSKAGTVILGSGFTAKKLGTGSYEITLTSELSTEGIMVLTALENFHAALIVTEAGKKVFKVGNWNNALAQEDTAFHFIIVPA